MHDVGNLSRDYIPVRMHHPFPVTGLDLDLVSTHTRCADMPCNAKNLRHTLEVSWVGGLEGLVESLRPDVTRQWAQGLDVLIQVWLVFG